MNVLLVSRCHHNALRETRRILDQFAERRGERVWQTAITALGLDTLRRLLKKTARKNTAVACHRLRGREGSELLWIVGDAGAFDERGAAPTDTTARDVLRARDEDDWHRAAVIHLLAALAALWHDLGKANDFFQAKLSKLKALADPLRHEWVSLRFFAAFVGEGCDDREWLARLADLPAAPDQDWQARLVKDQGGPGREEAGPLAALPPLAQAVGWLILSHHGLPQKPYQPRQPSPGPADLTREAHLKRFYASWCRARRDADMAACWSFSRSLPLLSPAWQKRARRLAGRALATPDLLAPATPWLEDPHVLHLARLVLMLADHHYSSLEDQRPRVAGAPGGQLWANTRRASGEPNQALDEHLLGVEREVGPILHALPRLERKLPRLARHKGFRQRSADPRFRWQDRAHDLAAGLRQAAREQGFFGVDLASTGCGKTLANGRIMYALADPAEGARFTLALGLRILTLQTGEAYRQRLGLGPDDLAVLAGGREVRMLYEAHRAGKDQEGPPSPLANQGRESAGELMPEGRSYLHYEGGLEPGPLAHWLAGKPGDRDAQRLLNAPILACTIDHLMPATEGLRGGRQLVPMLRLMSADLVLDEPDDFAAEDLPALARLVNWAGLLGSRLLLSSATLPPALVAGLFEAYLAGRRHYQANRGIPGQPLEVCCAWFDEFSCQAGRHAATDSFLAQHRDWVAGRLAALARKTEVRRRARLAPLAATGRDYPELAQGCARTIQELARQLHQAHHTPDPRSGRRVSFGLVRLANITPLVEVARALAGLAPPAGCRFHLCCYHAQHPLLVRAAIEARLDRLLDRHQPERIFADPWLRNLLDAGPEEDHIFLVLATPVAEVGRDHDYDWAVVEPSSLRSIIQLAGRVRRHRPGPCALPNLCLLTSNLRSLRDGEARPTFCRPGFESPEFRLASHRLEDLLTPEQYATISAAPRLAERPGLPPEGPYRNLADLEHAHLKACLLGDSVHRLPPASLWWRTTANLSGWLQQVTPFRATAGQARRTYALLLDEDTGEPVFHRLEEDGESTKLDHLLRRPELPLAPGVSLWGAPADYREEVERLARELGLAPEECARRFGTVELRGSEEEEPGGWDYWPALGLRRKP